MSGKQNEMQLFTNSVFGNVRATLIDGKVWFMGRDVVEDLGYKKHYSTVIKDKVKEKYQMKLSFSEMGKLGVSDTKRQGETLVNQYGVIQLVMSSQLEQAEQFQDWIIEEVIPSILETGSYSIKQQTPQFTPEQLMVAEMYGQASRGNMVEFLEVTEKFGNEKHKQGRKEGIEAVTDSGTLSNAGVLRLIQQTYPEEWEAMKDIYKDESYGTFSKFLRAKGYLYTKHYEKVDRRGMEVKWSYQPTQKFYDELKGYATAKEVDDWRDKKVITYTGLIKQLIETEAFRLSFFQWTESIKDDTMKYDIFGRHEKMEPAKHIMLDNNKNKPAIKVQEW